MTGQPLASLVRAMAAEPTSAEVDTMTQVGKGVEHELLPWFPSEVLQVYCSWVGVLIEIV